jgi:hypothetical protein
VIRFDSGIHDSRRVSQPKKRDEGVIFEVQKLYLATVLTHTAWRVGMIAVSF